MRGRSYLFFHETRPEESRVFEAFSSVRHIRTVDVRGRGDRLLRRVFVYEVTLPP